MATTREQMDADRAAFDDEFDQEHVAPRSASDEEVFGLLDEFAQEDDATGTPAQDAQTQGKADADTPDPATQQKTQHLQEWEQRLQAQQLALDARAAAMGTSNVNQQQTNQESSANSGANGGGLDGDDSKSGEEVGEGEGEADPAIRLVEDFGAEFVALVKLLVAKECKANLHDCMGDVSSKVEQLIAELQEDRQQHHFRAIAAVHADFQEIVDSPEFTTWQQSQPAEQMPEIERVIKNGGAHEIIDLLTRFKEANTASHSPKSNTSQSKSVPHAGKVGKPDKDFDEVDEFDDFDDFDKHEFNDAALDAAEGVRSGSGGGLKLPKAPPASDDYSAAWDEA